MEGRTDRKETGFVSQSSRLLLEFLAKKTRGTFGNLATRCPSYCMQSIATSAIWCFTRGNPTCRAAWKGTSGKYEPGSSQRGPRPYIE